MAQQRIPAIFMRGGTSKAVVFYKDDLPEDLGKWDDIFLSVMGSPDPSGRQLDGMGGGISSLSKVCVIGPPTRDDADVDYTFAQISVRGTGVDYSGNCGNMSSAMGPAAVELGLVQAPRDGEAVVRIHNTNTSKIIRSRFTMMDGVPETDGEFAIDGVAGTTAPIRLEFLDPGGAKTGRLLPTGRVRDDLDVPGMGSVTATLVDAANPCVFVDASALGKEGTELPDALEADAAFLDRMEAIRCAASLAMGIAPDLESARATPSVPKVAIVAGPQRSNTLSGRTMSPDDMSIIVRMISIGQPHRAVPITGAICLGIASRLEGSIPYQLSSSGQGPITVAHPSGSTVVDAEIENPGDPASAQVSFGAVYRTARRLFDGHVLYRPRVGASAHRNVRPEAIAAAAE
jgi:2-methylaconitate cis-trans-isomerase PrpF